MQDNHYGKTLRLESTSATQLLGECLANIEDGHLWTLLQSQHCSDQDHLLDKRPVLRKGSPDVIPVGRPLFPDLPTHVAFVTCNVLVLFYSNVW